jgi:predicted RNA-binding Zn-ribbon protein involved in translation (DUF1610 family)
MTEGRRKKMADEINECTSCGEYFGSSEECPLCGSATVSISESVEAFKDPEEDGVYSGSEYSKMEMDDGGDFAGDSDFSFDSDDYVPEAI